MPPHQANVGVRPHRHSRTKPPCSFSRNPDGSIAGRGFRASRRRSTFGGSACLILEGASIKSSAHSSPPESQPVLDVVVTGFLHPARPAASRSAFSEPTVAVGDVIVVKAGNPKKISSYKTVIADPSLKLAGVVGAGDRQMQMPASGQPAHHVPDFVSAVAALKLGRVDGALRTAITAQTDGEDVQSTRRSSARFPSSRRLSTAADDQLRGPRFRPEDKDLLDTFNAELAKTLGGPEHLKILEYTRSLRTRSRRE